MSEAMDFLMGSGGTSASFAGTPPITHKGKVIAESMQQQRDLSTGEKKFWDVEQTEPMMQLVVTLDTGVIDPTIEDDDGVRKIYAKAQMLGAIRDAVKKSGYRGKTLVGGNLAVKYVKDGETTKRGFNPPKIYAALYEPPSAVDAMSDALGAEEVYDDGHLDGSPF